MAQATSAATRGRRLTLVFRPPLPSPASNSKPGYSSGSRYSCLGSEYSSSDEENAPPVGIKMAMDVLDDGEPAKDWTKVARRKKKTEAEIVQDFWTDAGFPTPASRFWERRSSSPPENSSDHAGMEMLCREQQEDAMDKERRDQPSAPESGSASVVPPRRSPSSSPTGVRVTRAPRMGAWRGPLPPRRITPPAVLGQFLAAAKQAPDGRRGGSPLPGSSPRLEEPSAARSATVQNPVDLDGGPTSHGFSWACLRGRMKALWSGYPTSSSTILGAVSASTSPAAPPPSTTAPTSPPFAQPVTLRPAAGAVHSFAAVVAPSVSMAAPPPRDLNAAGGPLPRGPTYVGAAADSRTPGQ